MIGVGWRRVASLVTMDDGLGWHGTMNSRCGVGDVLFFISPWRTFGVRIVHILGLARVMRIYEGLWVGGGLGLWIGGLGLDGGMGLDGRLRVGGGLGLVGGRD